MFSLILPSIGRLAEPERFLRFLDAQTVRDFELIVVDQNSDNQLGALLDRFRERFPIVHLRTPTRGAARARNAGIARAQGDLIAFPDDDCWYVAPDLLERVAGFFESNRHFDALSGSAIDAEGKPSHLHWRSTGAELNAVNYARRTIEFTLFSRRRLVEAVGQFDPDLGPGSGTVWGCGEGADFVLRAIKMGFRIWYDSSFQVGHPQPISIYDQQTIRRAYSYGMGTGRIWRRYGYPIWAASYYCLRPFVAGLLAAMRGRRDMAAYYFATARGRVLGWRTSE
jgi:glycosyltransferase involved in cell wall biosynthesis